MAFRFFPREVFPAGRPARCPNELPLAWAATSGRRRILLQVHYHKSGKDEPTGRRSGCTSRRSRSKTAQIRNRDAAAPVACSARPACDSAGEGRAYEIKGSLDRILRMRHLPSVIPHMHWLGKDFTLEAILPDGARRTLIKIEDWDFNWQGDIRIREQVALPKGTRIEMAAYFDNSAQNPKKPEQAALEVRWGEQTTDEMCIGFLQLTQDDERLKNRPPERFRANTKKNQGPASSD